MAPRTSSTRCALAVIVLALGMVRAGAEDGYPTRPIDLYIGSAPAGSTDVLGRVLAKSLETALGQPVIVQNTPGAGGSVMAMQLLRRAPDGYSLGMTISHAYSGNPLVTPAATTYAVDDFTHLASVSKGQCALVTSSTKPYESLDEVVAAARRGEAPIFASQSALTRIVADYIAAVANVEFRIITVQGGGEMMQTILGGHADFGFSGGPHVDHVAAGQMRVLASVEDARLATSPEAPTLKELGYDLASCALFVVSAPPNLPADIERRLSAALEQAIGSTEMKDLIENLEYPEYYLGPADVTRALETEAATLSLALTRIGEQARRSGGDLLSPAFMPYIASLLGVAALTFVLVARRFTGRPDPHPPLSRESWLFIALSAVLLVTTFAVMELFGFLAGGAVIIAGFMVLARAELKIIAGTAVALPVLLWLLFDRLLGFPLP